MARRRVFRISDEQKEMVLSLGREGNLNKKQIGRRVNLAPASVWKLCHTHGIKLPRSPRTKKRGPYKLRSREVLADIPLRPVHQIKKSNVPNVTEIILELLIAQEKNIISMNTFKTVLSALTRE